MIDYSDELKNILDKLNEKDYSFTGSERLTLIILLEKALNFL